MNQNQTDQLYYFKVVLIGDSTVGKTSLIQFKTQKKFATSTPTTVGVDFFNGEIVEFNNKKFRPQIWDSAGQEKYKSMAKSYAKQAHAIIFVFSLDNVKSFDNLESWVNEIKDEAETNFVVALAGNKSDCEIKISSTQIEQKKEQIQNLINQQGQQHDFQYFQTSASKGNNVKQLFDWVFERTAALRLLIDNKSSICSNPAVFSEGRQTLQNRQNETNEQNKQKCC